MFPHVPQGQMVGAGAGAYQTLCVQPKNALSTHAQCQVHKLAPALGGNASQQLEEPQGHIGRIAIQGTADNKAAVGLTEMIVVSDLLSRTDEQLALEISEYLVEAGYPSVGSMIRALTRTNCRTISEAERACVKDAVCKVLAKYGAQFDVVLKQWFTVMKWDAKRYAVATPAMVEAAIDWPPSSSKMLQLRAVVDSSDAYDNVREAVRLMISVLIALLESMGI